MTTDRSWSTLTDEQKAELRRRALQRALRRRLQRGSPWWPPRGPDGPGTPTPIPVEEVAA